MPQLTSNQAINDRYYKGHPSGNLKSRLATILITILVVATGWYFLLHKRNSSGNIEGLDHPLKVTRPPYDPLQNERTIASFSAGIKRDPQDVLACQLLSHCYLQRYRETGDLADVTRAELMARRSLANRSYNNNSAYIDLARSLASQHRFPDALIQLQRSGKLDNSNSQAVCQSAEILVENGDYSAAEEMFQRLKGEAAEDISAMVVRARLLEINGSPDRALALLRQAQSFADRDFDMSSEAAAWFHMRVGDLLAAQGKADEADQVYRSALDIFPRHYQTLTALARLSAGRGNWQAVLDWGKKSAAVVPTPEVVALMGDAYTALGDKKSAEEQYKLVDIIAMLARSQGVVYDRQRALFCADHNIHLEEALKMAERELTLRHDIYAYDTLAWVQYKRGRLREANAAMQKAMARGTQDSRLYFHAGMIANASNDRKTAHTLLGRALSINPYFLPFGPSQAKLVLAKSG